MSATKLSARYAKSLLDLAIEKNALSSVVDDMTLLKETIHRSHDLRILLQSPIIGPAKKLKILEKVFAGRIGEFTHTFVILMVNKGREPYLLDITTAFTEQYNVYKQITPVKIISAAELDPKLVDELVAKIKKEANIVNLELTTAIDPTLVGGFRVQYEDKLYDASLSTELDDLKKEFHSNEFISQI